MAKIKFEVVSGVEGYCLLMDDYRIAGPKSWVSGHVVHSFEVDPSELEETLAKFKKKN